MTEQFVYKTNKVCASEIKLELEGDKIKNVFFTGGCNGNSQGISSLVIGMRIDEVIDRLKGIRCKSKETSCPDQLSKALEAFVKLKAETI